MTLAIHQNTSSGAGYRGSLEGWSRAGIKHVEITAALLDDFLKTDTLAAAGRVLSDFGLTPVCAAMRRGRLWEPNASRAASLEAFKKRCEMLRDPGADPHLFSDRHDSEIHGGGFQVRTGPHASSGGDCESNFACGRRPKFIRTSTVRLHAAHAAENDPTAAQPNMAILLDFYHFWSGLNKLEDLDLIRPGEIGHVHFQDVPDIPRELLDSSPGSSPATGLRR